MQARIICIISCEGIQVAISKGKKKWKENQFASREKNQAEIKGKREKKKKRKRIHKQKRLQRKRNQRFHRCGLCKEKKKKKQNLMGTMKIPNIISINSSSTYPRCLSKCLTQTKTNFTLFFSFVLGRKNNLLEDRVIKICKIVFEK